MSTKQKKPLDSVLESDEDKESGSGSDIDLEQPCVAKVGKKVQINKIVKNRLWKFASSDKLKAHIMNL